VLLEGNIPEDSGNINLYKKKRGLWHGCKTSIGIEPTPNS